MSQCSRVLEVLRDGKPHSIEEIHERAGTMRLNSRISDLRRMGYFITYFRKDGLHTYQLLYGIVRSGDVAPDGLADGLSPVRTVLDSGPPESAQTPESAADGGPRSLPSGGHQLSVWEAA